MLPRLKHPANALLPIEVTLSWIVTLESDSHDAKQLSLILVHFVGMEKLESALQPEKAPVFIFSRELSIVTVERFSHSLKA
jgi:hypothetical protein